MRMKALWLSALFLLVSPVALVAQDDAEGCKDSPLLTRMPGCVIADCSKSEFDAAELQTSLTKDPRTTHVEGKIEKIHYTCTGKSALQVRRNAEQALRAAGFDIGATETPITPIIVGEARTAHEFSAELFREGLWATGIGFPTVPRGKARIRTIVTAAHTREQLDRAVSTLTRVAKRMAILPV